jgi:hypothetical protein
MAIVLLIQQLYRVDLRDQHVIYVFSIAELENRKRLGANPEKVLALAPHIKCFQRCLVKFDQLILQNRQNLTLVVIAKYIGLCKIPD